MNALGKFKKKTIIILKKLIAITFDSRCINRLYFNPGDCWFYFSYVCYYSSISAKGSPRAEVRIVDVFGQFAESVSEHW